MGPRAPAAKETNKIRRSESLKSHGASPQRYKGREETLLPASCAGVQGCGFCESPPVLRWQFSRAAAAGSSKLLEVTPVNSASTRWTWVPSSAFNTLSGE